MGWANYIMDPATGLYVESVYCSAGGLSTPALIQLKCFLYENCGKDLRLMHEESLWDDENMCVYEKYKEYTIEDANKLYLKRFGHEIHNTEKIN